MGVSARSMRFAVAGWSRSNPGFSADLFLCSFSNSSMISANAFGDPTSLKR